MKNEKHNQGLENIVAKRHWVSPDEIYGEKNVLTSKLMKYSFDHIMENHEMKSEICFMSLCTKTRPYDKGYKWKKLRNDFVGKYASKIDLLVCSNGGIIPERFWYSYPYLTYDAPREKMYDAMYKRIFAERLERFLRKFKYKYIIADFSPNSRVRHQLEISMPFLKSINVVDNYHLSPSKSTHDKMKWDAPVVIDGNEYKLGSTMYPTFHPLAYMEMNEVMRRYVKQTITAHPDRSQPPTLF